LDLDRDPLELDRDLLCDFSDFSEDLFDKASSSEESGLELRLDEEGLGLGSLIPTLLFCSLLPFPSSSLSFLILEFCEG
jgi:hypothetical protein